MNTQSAATDTRVRAAQVLQKEGLNKSEIGRTLGVAPSTVTRWLDPEAAERSRRSSKAAKLLRTGNCIDCNTPTSYDGRARKGESNYRRCRNCANLARHLAIYWTREKVIDAIQRFALANGRPPISTDWSTADKANDYPSKTQVYRHPSTSPSAPFAFWADAIEAAGFPRPRPGKRAQHS